MDNIFFDNKKLISAIAEMFSCTIMEAKDRLFCDLRSGGDGETGGLISPQLHEEARELGAQGLSAANDEFFEAMKELCGLSLSPWQTGF